MKRRPGFLPGTPNWALKFIVSEVLAERPSGRPEQRRRGPRPLPGLPERPGTDEPR